MKTELKLKVIAASIIAMIFLFPLDSSCQKSKNSSAKPKLIFQSGFEESSKVIPVIRGKYSISHDDDIIGVDKTLKGNNDWIKDLDNDPDGGEFSIQYTGGDSTKRYAKIIPEPGNPSNKVLYYWLDDSWLADLNTVKARIQTNLYGIKKGYKEFYQSERVFLHDDFNSLKSYPRKIGWLTISEFWNNRTWGDAPYAFRVTLGIGKPTEATSDLYFILDGQDYGDVNGKLNYTTLWHNTNEKVKVPIGKWFTMEYYYKEGNNETGRFYMAIKPEGQAKQVVFDVTAFTQNSKDPNPDGVTEYNPMKLYTSKEVVGFMKSQGKTLQIYWDDFKLWKNKRP
ncbi:MAG TPA: hypothetical protein VMV77_21565 [Bacteroidales bacterium]|nr:hypothetical protein [Bacteroidales bacterium]